MLSSPSKIKNIDTYHSFKDDNNERTLSKTPSQFPSQIYEGILNLNVENQSVFYKNSSRSSIMMANRLKEKDFIV
jgi:hypothetical protein